MESRKLGLDPDLFAPGVGDTGKLARLRGAPAQLGLPPRRISKSSRIVTTRALS